MSAKAKTCGNHGKGKAATGFAKPRKVTAYQGRRQEANREKRQELARLRHEASLNSVGQPAPPHQQADRKRLQGKGLFYCESPVARAKEIQRRLMEAEQEKLRESSSRTRENR
jgi:hypothetical protein